MSPDLANMARGVAAEAALRNTARLASERDPTFMRALWGTLHEFGGAEAIREIHAGDRVRGAEQRENFRQLWAYLMDLEVGAASVVAGEMMRKERKK